MGMDPSLFNKNQNLPDQVKVPMNDGLVSDYINMMTPDNSREI